MARLNVYKGFTHKIVSPLPDFIIPVSEVKRGSAATTLFWEKISRQVYPPRLIAANKFAG
jgi:hypothetical protein